MKLLDDTDETRWRVAVDGVEGYVPPSCLLTTGGSGVRFAFECCALAALFLADGLARVLT